MKKLISVFLLFLGIVGLNTTGINAQSLNDNTELDQGIDQSLNQIESFLDTFSLDQMLGSFNMNGFLGENFSPQDMEEIQEQMKIGIEQMRGFDMTIFEGFVKELEKSLGGTGTRRFTPDPAEKYKEPKQEPARGLKKI